MNVNQMNLAEKQIYWKAFYEQREIIDSFCAEMIVFNPEYESIDSREMLLLIDEVFDGIKEHEYALRAVSIYRDEEAAKALQIELDLEFAQALA